MSKLPARPEQILNDFISRLTQIQPNLLEGLYLTGSIPLGDYYEQKSDIDFLAILKENPGSDILKQFESIHLYIEHAYNNPKLNGYYLTLEGIKKQQNFPSFFEGKMRFERPFELDKVTLFELQTIALPVLGKPITGLPIEITIDEVVSQLHENINSYWTTWINNHSGFKVGYLYLVLFPRLTEWGILGVARQLYTLDTGKITSKFNAGQHCLDKLPAYFHDIILTAIETRKINRTQLKPSFERAQKTIKCMEFIINDFNKIFGEKEYPSL